MNTRLRKKIEVLKQDDGGSPPSPRSDSHSSRGQSISSPRNRSPSPRSGSPSTGSSSVLAPKKSKRQLKREKESKRLLIYIIICLICLFFGQVLLTTLSSTHKAGFLDSIGLAVGFHRRIYFVVIDAGSTGSRVLTFCFYRSNINGRIKVYDELYVEQKPGLSAYANDPIKGGEKILELLEKTKTFVPMEEWENTMVVLRGTAGLRLLPEEKAKAIIEAMNDVIELTPFFNYVNAASIMEGSDEGVYAWTSVNYLLDKFDDDPLKLVATLDLGGGSTQITYPLLSVHEVKAFDSKDVKYMSMLYNDYDLPVYTHSYLGLGLMAARKAILTMDNPVGATDLVSECINPVNKKKTFTYGGVEYSVRGPANPMILKKKKSYAEGGFDKIPVVRLKECTDLARKYIASQNVTKPIAILQHEIYAFSYFFERAAEVGLIDAFNGGTVLLRDLKKATAESCQDPNVERPFMCVDLVFITTLLEMGYGFQPDTPIKIVNRIDDHEVSWAIGLAYDNILIQHF